MGKPEKMLLGYWRKMFKEEPPPADVFREGDKEHWIAIQKPSVDDLEKDVHSGQTIKGYVIWIGAIKPGKQWEWLFAMNGFDGSPPDTKPNHND